MLICEFDFAKPSSENPMHSDYEIDFYSWSKFGDSLNHRLSLRRNLFSNRFEVYRSYTASGEEEVVYSGDLSESLSFADGEVFKYHLNHTMDEICDHSMHP